MTDPLSARRAEAVAHLAACREAAEGGSNDVEIEAAFELSQFVADLFGVTSEDIERAAEPTEPIAPTARLRFELVSEVHDILTASVETTRAELDAAVAELHTDGRAFEALDDWEQYDVVASLALGGDPEYRFSAQGDCDAAGTRIDSVEVLGDDD